MYWERDTHKDQLCLIWCTGVSGMEKLMIMLRYESMKNLTEIICIPVCCRTSCIYIQVFFSLVNFLKLGFRIKMALACK